MTFTGFSIISFSFFLFLLGIVDSKKESTNLDPKGYFAFPIEPGSQTSLSGTFGDIRINHFHAGLDIRTGGREGKSVYAAAEGYVSRIKVANGGYGNALYITHPNGLTTVYGHLKDYNKVIKNVLVSRQYEVHSFEVDIELKPNELPVNKGELVAFSGNTGGSGGPHLHFEIRDQEENTLDPSLFGFDEIKDNVAPVVEFISLKCLSADARINGAFGVFDFSVTQLKNGDYQINEDINAWGDIGLELSAYDKSQTSPFRLGIKSIELKKDNITEFKFVLDKLAFHNKIDMNLHANYERMVNENIKIHKAYVEEGNSMKLYKTNSKNGYLSINSFKSHAISIKLKDTYQNERNINFQIQGNKAGTVKDILSSSQKNKTSIQGHFVKIIRQSAIEKLRLIDGNFVTEIEPSYTSPNEQIYIIDLNDVYFSKFSDRGAVYEAPYTVEITNHFATILRKDFELNLKNALYHQLYVRFRTDGKVLDLDDDVYPLKDKFDVKWLPNLPYAVTEKDAAYLISGRRPKFVGGTWNGLTVSFQPKEFGSYEILRDETKPNISTRNINANSLTFNIKDDLSGIKSYECFVSGEWVLMEYEYKDGLLWSEKKNGEPFVGEVILKVTDNCNNTEIFKTNI
jgi:hypothetical protein